MEHEDKIWLGTDGGGINIWDRSRKSYSSFQNLPDQKESLGSNAVMDLHKDKRGAIWAGTWAGGLNRYEGGNQFKKFMNDPNDPSSIPSNMVFGINEDQEGYVWLALWNKGISRFNHEDESFYSINKDTHGEDIWLSDFTNTLLIDGNNTLWVGTEIGLNRIDFRSYPDDFSITSYLYDENDPTSISDNNVNQIFEDHLGQIWVCTTQGLNLFDAKTSSFTRFDKTSGLASNFIQSIVQDSRQHYWVTTNKGICQIQRKGSEYILQNYDQTDGVQGDSFIRGASYMTSDNTMLLGGTNGFNHFTLDMVKNNPYTPKIQFTSLMIFNEEVNSYDENSPINRHINTVEEIELDHHQSVFSISYVGVSLTHADRTEYAFQLEGLEKEWNYVGNQRIASYSNLEPKRYTFKVKAANNDGLWTKDYRSVTIIVHPPWWQEWWFRGIIIFMAGLIIFTIYYLRSRQIKENRRYLEQKITEAVAESDAQKERNCH